MDRPNASEEIEPVIKNLLTKRSPVADGLNGKFQRTSKEELRPIFIEVFQKIEDETLQQAFMRPALS